MASVWRAADETLQRDVAIKLLYFRAHRDPQQAVEQFLREARIAASIQHRNVVQTVDFGTTDDGIPYMVMELLQGESLASRMEREPRLGMREFVRLASLTLRGLAAVHDAGIVHRDLKPQNIFLQQDGDDWYPKILDFGISRSLGAGGERPSPIATQQGLVIGTPHYMSPEQARGEAQIDKRADIYSMGAIIYEAMTGHVPFDAETPGELLVKIMAGDPPPMRAVHPEIPELLSDCVAQAMAHDREHRFMDARVFRRALQSVADATFPEGALGGSEVPESKAQARPEPRAAAPAGVTVAQAVAPERSAAAPAWGDFEGLKGRSERPARAPSPPPPAAAAIGGGGAVRSAARAVSAQLSAVATAPAARAAPAPRPAPPRAASAPLARASQAQAMPAKGAAPAGAAFDEPLMGDNPLDAFNDNAAALLDIDYGEPVPRSSRQSPAPRTPKRMGATGYVTHDDRKAVARASRRGPSALWILPALLLMVVFVLLLAPGLFSVAPPDQAAAMKQEAQNPATRGSDRQLSTTRSAELANTPGARGDL
jgi:eukaryotic-like serine/threonine-protein kinase